VGSPVTGVFTLLLKRVAPSQFVTAQLSVETLRSYLVVRLSTLVI
jgi:hypothetical protein